MRRKRRNHSPSFKAKVALAALKGDRTVAELCSEFDIHANQVTAWKKQLLEGAQDVFDTEASSKANALQENKVKELHAKIGELAMEKDFLSKALSRGQ